jgi:hypothetical protein
MKKLENGTKVYMALTGNYGIILADTKQGNYKVEYSDKSVWYIAYREVMEIK